MRESDLRELTAVMRRAAQASRARKHDLEAAMGVSHGRMEDLWSGTLELKVRHLVGLAELLEIPPSEILAAGCPHAQAAGRRLSDWIGPVEPPFAARRAEQERSAAEADDERLRRVVREEIAAALGSKARSKAK
jgi:hypothetical protein